MQSIFISLIFTFGGLVHAKEVTAHSLKVSQIVDEFYNARKSHDECRTPGVDCLDTVCKLLGTYGCDDRSEVEEALKWCRGNFDGDCIATACKYISPYGCDDRSEVQAMARACIGNLGGSCIDAVCKRLGTYGCDDRSEVLDVIKQCAGN